MATDQSVVKHIKDLAAEEHHLYERGALSDDDKARLKAINIALDQYWDLLRQRRAKREFGKNPDEAEIRRPGIVEKYEG
ncbi:MAG TPA: DUF2630 family protein [Bauldia sp.]|jgi:hypothetical protein